MSDARRVVDAHVHLGPPKYAPVESLRAMMPAEGVSGAVLVQHLGNTDNAYLSAIRAADPARFAAVAIVDRLDDVGPVLDAGFAGLRLAPTGLADAAGTQVFDLLDDRGAAVSVTGPPSEVASGRFRTTVRGHPHIRFRIEHVGGFRYGTSAEDGEQFAALLRLAEEPNVSLMWSGFFLNAGTPFPYPDTHPFLAETLAAFGSSRVMWSGDWNRAGLGPSDYRQAIELVGLVTTKDEERTDVLARTAERIFAHAFDDEGALHA